MFVLFFFLNCYWQLVTMQMASSIPGGCFISLLGSKETVQLKLEEHLIG